MTGKEPTSLEYFTYVRYITHASYGSASSQATRLAD